MIPQAEADKMWDELANAGYIPQLLRCSLALTKNGVAILKVNKGGNEHEPLKRLYLLAKERKLI